MAERATGGGIGSADTSIYRVPESNPLQVAGQAVNLARGATGLQQDQLNLQMSRINAVNGVLSSLLADPEVQKGGDGAMRRITQASGQVVGMGIMSSKDLSQWMTTIDPKNPVAGLRQTQLQLLSPQDRLNATNGPLVQVNTGNQQTFFRAPAYGPAAGVPGAQFQNQPGPGELLQRVQGPPDATGAPTSTSLGGISAQEGALRPDMTLNTPGVGPGPVAPPNRLQQRATPAQGGLPVQPGAAPVGPAIPPPTQPGRGAAMPSAPNTMAQNGSWGRTPVGLPPGQPQALQIEQEAGANQGVALERAADSSPQRLGQLNNLEKNLAQFESGPLSERTRKIQGAVNQVGSIVGVQPFDAKALAAREGFVKESTMLAQQQFAALGGTGTDQQLGSAMKSNPSELLSKEGNRQIIAMLKGNEAALNAKNASWQQWKSRNGPGSYAAFSNDFNQNYSPRAFQWAFLPAEERKKMYDSMTPRERDQLGTSLKIAQDRGWIRPDGQKIQDRAK